MTRIFTGRPGHSVEPRAHGWHEEWPLSDEQNWPLRYAPAYAGREARRAYEAYSEGLLEWARHLHGDTMRALEVRAGLTSDAYGPPLPVLLGE